MDEPTPEQAAAIEKWLETEAGQKYIKNVNKIFILKQEQKDTINDFSNWLETPEKNKDESYKLIGKFLVKFSHLEALLRLVFGIESKVQSSMKETLMMTFDFSLLVSTLKSFYEIELNENKALQKKMIAALNKCLSLNNERVQVAHGTWILSSEKTAKLLKLQRGNLSSRIHYGDHAALQGLISNAEDAFKQIVSALHEVYDYDADKC